MTTSCYIFLLIMGLVFVLGGSLLSVIAFVPQQKKEWTYDLHKSNKTQIVGPILICVGVIIIVAGGTLTYINKKLRNGGRLIQKGNPYAAFSTSSSFSNMPSQLQNHSPGPCFSINQNSLTLESLSEIIGRSPSPSLTDTIDIKESSFVASVSQVHKEEPVTDIACFPTSCSPILEIKTTKKTNILNTPLLHIPEIYITQPSPIPRLQSYAKIKKKRRNSFRLRHKVNHDMGATKSPETIQIPTSRRASFHGDSVEPPQHQVQSSSPKSLPLIISLYDTYLNAKSQAGDQRSEPSTGDSVDDREWSWRDRSDSPTVDTDSIRINLEKLQED